MDKQDQFYKVEPCFSADEMLVKTPQCTNLSTDVTNAEYRSPAETSWQLSLAANNQSSTFQTFVADSAIPKDNSQQKSKTKSSKRKLQCAKMRRISDKGQYIGPFLKPASILNGRAFVALTYYKVSRFPGNRVKCVKNKNLSP